MKSTDKIEVNLEIPWEMEEFVVRQSLLRSMAMIEQDGDEEDVGFYDSLSEVVAFYSDPTQLEEMENRDIPLSWLDIIVNARA